jgi:hypothetical protein
MFLTIMAEKGTSFGSNSEHARRRLIVQSLKSRYRLRDELVAVIRFERIN